ncbi:peptidoglycan/LPS O-acetylase OafA/YrhL [Conyzicola lurida]|uniref:Peptidoglycan/LPS O-acetylase OafA/YrhL n=1 Tax=Conyzicola lurida TaxID=1172621 RepID=A0A841APJ9_9MICO|nr:peptidoglycan/LPS O-acetylase OafA/YrhL [Conyzicola lurida]
MATTKDGNSTKSVAGGGFRPEIQALRAAAVFIVVVYHLWPAQLPGGYVGVDVFFVISGFLITSHLLGEVHRTGTVSLSRFWARRIRRLLPASLLVLAATLVAALIWLPNTVLQQNLEQIGASAIYLVNWLLARDAVDYLGAENASSMVQHFWSLSVEEQFYIGWPVLLVVVLAIVRIGRSRVAAGRLWPSVRLAVTVALVGVFLVSLAYSIWQTNRSQPLAYFSTFARAWEFAAGALLAAGIVLWPKLGSPAGSTKAPVVGEIATWLGIAMIGGSAFVFQDSSPFPGSIALIPVVGSVLFIVGAGMTGPKSLTRRLFSLTPIQRVGDWSYAIYLWHWPFIVLFPFVFHAELGVVGKVAIAVVSVLLGYLTKILVEDPVRSGRWWARRRWPSFALAVVGALLLITVSTGGSVLVDREKDQARVWAQEQLDSDAPCFGARAMAEGADCAGKFDLSDRTDIGFAATDLDPDWCVAEPGVEWASCEYGDTTDPTATIALVGDSHAASLVPAFDEYFAEQGWRVVTYLRVGCPAATVNTIIVPGREQWAQDECTTWSGRVLDEVEERDDIDVVAFSNFSVAYLSAAVPSDQQLTAQEIASTWTAVEESGKQVVFVRDVPGTGQSNVPNCLAKSVAVESPCSTERSASVPDNAFITATTLDDRVPLIDMTDYFCDEDTCYSVIGDVVTYADSNHVSGTYVKTLAPFLGDRIMAALAR